MSISSKHPESFRQSLGQLMTVNNWVNKLYISSSQSDINLTASEAVTLYQPLRNTVNPAKKFFLCNEENTTLSIYQLRQQVW